MTRTIKEGKLIYHLTTLDVFESIVKNGLLSRDALNEKGLDFVDTANHDILEGRARLNLNSYIPFHFHIHTNYDTFVKSHHKNKEFLYLCLHRDYARNNDFAILPIHPTSAQQPELYSYDEGMAEIDWDVMELTKPEALYRGIDENYRGQVRMAECLSPIDIPINDFLFIKVKDDDVKEYVEDILKKYGVESRFPYVNVAPNMF